MHQILLMHLLEDVHNLKTVGLKTKCENIRFGTLRNWLIVGVDIKQNELVLCSGVGHCDPYFLKGVFHM